MGRDIVRLGLEKAMKKLLILVFVLFLPLEASAETPSWYPQKGYELNGIVQQLDLRGREIVISDDKLIIASRVKVHSLTNEYLSLSSLKVGDIVGVDITEYNDGKVEVVEIWILDKDKPMLFSSELPDSSDTPTPQTISDQQLKKQDRVSSKVRK